MKSHRPSSLAMNELTSFPNPSLGFLRLQLEAVSENTPRKRLAELACISSELEQLVAKNPYTPADLLRKLADSDNAIACKNIAANPNTPTDVLLKLGAKFPQQLLNNPVFFLVLLENPNLVNEMPILTLLGILKQERVPAFLFEQAVNRINLAQQGDDPLADLFNREIEETEDSKIGAVLGMNAETPKTVLEKLVQSQNPTLQEIAKLHIHFAEASSLESELAIAEAIGQATIHRQTFETYLKELAQTNSLPDFLRKGLSQKTLRQLEAVQQIPPPANVWEQLVLDVDRRVREELAVNPNTPISILEKLAIDREEFVRWSVFENPHTPPEIREKLSNENFLCFAPILTESTCGPRQHLASQLTTPTEVLAKLAKDKSLWVRALVARNPNTPPSTLEQLAADDYEMVRRNVASNPKTPPHSLAQLAGDRYAGIRCKVALNPHTPMGILTQLLSDRSECVLKFAVPRYLALNPHRLSIVLKQYRNYATASLSRLVILLHPQTSSILLSAKCRSSLWLERYAIASHANTPLDSLAILAKDGNRIVRAVAQSNLQNRPLVGQENVN